MSDKARIFGFTVLACLLLPGGGYTEGVLDSAGPISEAERTILLDSLAIMLALVIPTMIATLVFAWWFRASNTKARYLPDWAYSGRLELLVWSVPILIILFLGGITWISSHDLDPARPIASKQKPLEVQVVSLDWKWLFIYPQQSIASINRMVVPVDTPLNLHITSASVFNVFFVPQLGSQIYAMNGMVTQLNLLASKPGEYAGVAAHFSGDGFSDMGFDVQAVPSEQFKTWVSMAKTSGMVLNSTTYRRLLKQSENVTPYTYRAVQSDLFDAIAAQKLPSGEGPEMKQAGKEE